MHTGASPAVPELQDLHDAGQRQANQEESQGGVNMDGVTEARDLNPDR